MKQVIVVNQGLRLPKGKLAAQVAHAAVGAYLAANKQTQRLWLEEGMPKIVVQVPDEQALLQLAEQANRDGLPTLVVQDAGKTVLPAGTTTCLGIGPAPDEQLDHLTGTLPLL
jgi:peptidyl-tRNA hydrolase, PTH2 family